jgi:dTDP-4-amino-4,6-dideoxygalactose transaminase
MSVTFEIREIPFAALGGVFEQDDIDAANRVMQQAAAPGGSFFPLPEENDFQRALARHEGAAHAVAVNSCGTALDLCLMALDVGPGDEVITTPLTFVCTATCAVALGAKVVFADIDPVTKCLDPASVSRRITSQTKAILPVHFAGLAADCDGFDEITSQTGVPVIYDAAHAVGTKYRGEPIGGRGLASCYSFQSNKNMTTLGEGGAVTTNDKQFAEIVRQKKTFGYVYGPQLRVATVGFNYRMTKPQCAVGLTQLAKIDRVIAQRLEVFQQMHDLLEDVEDIIRPAGIEPGHGCHLYVARLDSSTAGMTRAEFLATLKDRYRIACGIHYPAVWTWDAMRDLGYSEAAADCPLAARAAEQVVSLPLFCQTTPDDCEYIAWAIKETLAGVT